MVPERPHFGQTAGLAGTIGAVTGQVQSLTVEGFRSIRGLEIRFGNVNLITGPNGCGKSNLFNAFRLLKSAVEGRLAQSLADEGGLDSVLWAGPRSSGPVRLKLSVVTDPFEYTLELGLRPASELPLFPLDPQIKSEVVKLAGRVMVDRKSSVATMRGLAGDSELRTDLVDSESVFAQVRDPEKYGYLYLFRESVERWTFYHEFRTDKDSPVRRPALATFSPRLHEDGSNLGPAMYVTSERGEGDTLWPILRAAFPTMSLTATPESLVVHSDGIERAMSGRELSDGTLKFLCLAAACFPFRPSPLIAFNEPETSLNPSVLAPLADMFAHASQYSQLWITTHSEELTKHLVDRLACKPIRLDKTDGETVLEGRSLRRGQVFDE